MITLVELLTKHEGRRKFLYKDQFGKVTGGVGHNFTANGLSDGAIDFILHEDISNVEADLDHYLPWWRQLPPDVAMVVEDMTFNMGINRFLEFKQTLAYLKSGDYANAAKEMLDSAWARQVGTRAIEDSKLVGGAA